MALLPCLFFVENRARTYALFTLAEDSGTRPSELIGVGYPWVALDFDRAVYLWGNYVRAEVERVRNDVIAQSRKQKGSKLNPGAIAEAAEMRFNQLVLGVTRRTRQLWSLRNNCPLEIVEELRKGEDGQERWVRMSERLDRSQTRGGSPLPMDG